MAGWKSDNVEVNGVHLNYIRTGGEKQPIVLAHGVTDNAMMWVEIARVLEEDYDVIMYDRRGHGLSGASESGYAFSDHGVDLAAFISVLDLDRPVVVGHSGGAAAAACFASTHPELLSYLVLEDPPWGTGWGDWAEMTEGMTAYFTGIKTRSKEELTADCRQRNNGWSEEIISHWVESKLQVSPHVVGSFTQPKPDLPELLKSITSPVLIITSDLNLHPLNTKEDVALMESLWRDGRHVRIPGTTHTIHMDRPNAFLSVVTSFLDTMHEREKHCGFSVRKR